MASYSKTYGGAVYLSFNGDLVTLTAADLTTPRFSYKADSFYDAASLGKIDDAITSILTKFDNTIGGIINVADIKDEIDKLTNIPVLGQILTSELVITEFTIQPADEGKTNGNYAFGIGLKLTQDNTLGPVTLDGVAFSIGLTQTA
ncbi:MAG: hypothetical protein MK066_03465 [Crocinitomicaceae bacterium]|nr:hypothetical protein [Crocinitomicaceae bacterium]